MCSTCYGSCSRLRHHPTTCEGSVHCRYPTLCNTVYWGVRGQQFVFSSQSSAPGTTPKSLNNFVLPRLQARTGPTMKSDSSTVIGVSVFFLWEGWEPLGASGQIVAIREGPRWANTLVFSTCTPLWRQTLGLASVMGHRDVWQSRGWKNTCTFKLILLEAWTVLWRSPGHPAKERPCGRPGQGSTQRPPAWRRLEAYTSDTAPPSGTGSRSVHPEQIFTVSSKFFWGIHSTTKNWKTIKKLCS